MTMSPASARGSGEARGPIDALTASTNARRAAGGDRRSVDGRSEPGEAREGFDATMSRALQQARRDAAGHKGEDKGGRTQGTSASASRSGPESARSSAQQDRVTRAEDKTPAEGPSNERDDDEARTDGSSDTVAALLASADPAANAAAPITAACASSAESVTPLAAGADAVALAETSDARAPAAGKDAASGAAVPESVESTQQDDASLAAAATARRKIGADIDGGPASTAGTDDATDASSTASSESATHRASPDFAAQLAHVRPAAAPPSTFADASRNATGSPTPAPAPHAGLVSTPLHAVAFPAHFAAEVAVLGAAGIERAEIQLQPPELGPVRIELSLSGESTRVAFSAVQPETRHAIEQSLPILKDLLAERGLMLGDASVSDGGAHAGYGANDRAGSSDGAAGANAADSSAADGRNAAGDARRVALRRSLLDVYA